MDAANEPARDGPQHHNNNAEQQREPNGEAGKDYVTVNGFTGSCEQKAATGWRPRRRVNKSSICLSIILVTLFVILVLKLVVYIKYNRI